jgi:hypothetical protein
MTKALTDEQKAAILVQFRWRNLVAQKILQRNGLFGVARCRLYYRYDLHVNGGMYLA